MRIIKKIWWLPLVVYMTIIPSFISDKVYDEPCREIRVNIMDSSKYRFVTPGTLLSMIQTDNTSILGRGLNTIDLKSIENILSEVRELEKVEVYTTADGVLHVDADQRDPLMRVITSYGNNYYIDKEGFVIPHSISYTPHLIAVSGNIEVPDSCILGRSILEMDNEMMINKIFRIVNYINDNEFWNRLFEQIWISQKDEIELVPRMGDHIVKFGEAGNYEWKFMILESFYKQTLPVAGWNKYSEIDLRFEGQIVCRQ
jgi:cell division protein FtsQ